MLTALLIAEGVTILWLGGLRVEHMFVGLVLIPPVLLKLGSTGYRFARYYTGAPRVPREGPAAASRCGRSRPILVASTIVVFGTGVALLLIGHRSDVLLELHKVAFIVWGACFAVHFLWYLPHAWRALASAARVAGTVPGSMLRGLLVSASLGGGLALALALLSLIEAWRGRPQRLAHCGSRAACSSSTTTARCAMHCAGRSTLAGLRDRHGGQRRRAGLARIARAADPTRSCSTSGCRGLDGLETCRRLRPPVTACRC